jgi:hypothetical protein
MAEAIARGVIAAGVIPAAGIVASDPAAARRAVFETLGAAATADNAEAARSAALPFRVNFPVTWNARFSAAGGPPRDWRSAGTADLLHALHALHGDRLLIRRALDRRPRPPTKVAASGHLPAIPVRAAGPYSRFRYRCLRLKPQGRPCPIP